MYAVKHDGAKHVGMSDQEVVQRQLAALGRHIRALRISHGFSQVGFAVSAGFARAYYSSIENGERNISAINLIRLARALDVEVGSLFPTMSDLNPSESNAVSMEESIHMVSPVAELRENQANESSDIALRPTALVSAGAAARLLGVNRRTIERWVQDGTLTPAAIIEDQKGKHYSVFRPDDISHLAETEQSRRRTI